MLEALQTLSAREKELTALLQAHLESYDVTQALENQLPWQEQALQIHAELQAVYQEELSLFLSMSDEIQQQFIISHYPEMTETEHDDVLLLWMNWKSKLNISTANSEELPLFYFLSLKLLLIPTGRKLLGALFDELLKPANQLILQVGKSWGVPRAAEKNIATLNYPSDCLQKKISIFPRLIQTDDEKAPITFDVPYVTFAHELIHVLHQWQGADARKLTFPHGFFSSKFHLYNRDILADSEELQTVEGDMAICENNLRNEFGLAQRAGHISASLNNSERLAWLILVSHARKKEECSQSTMPITYTPTWRGLNGRICAQFAATLLITSTDEVSKTSSPACITLHH